MKNFIGPIRGEYWFSAIYRWRRTPWKYITTYSPRRDRLDFMKMEMMGGEPYYFDRGE